MLTFAIQIHHAMKFSKTIIVLFILIAVSTLVKIICAPQINLSGFTAVMAVSLFAGLTIKDKKLAFLFPLLALFITDVLLQLLYSVNLFPYSGFYSGQITNYVLFVLITLFAANVTKPVKKLPLPSTPSFNTATLRFL